MTGSNFKVQSVVLPSTKQYRNKKDAEDAVIMMICQMKEFIASQYLIYSTYNGWKIQLKKLFQ